MGYEYNRTLDTLVASLSCAILGSQHNWDLGWQFSKIQLNYRDKYILCSRHTLVPKCLPGGTVRGVSSKFPAKGATSPRAPDTMADTSIF